MGVKKINIVSKMTIHVINMFRICADTTSDYIIQTVLPWKMVFMGFQIM